MGASGTRDPALSELQHRGWREGLMQEPHQGADLFRLVGEGEVPNGHSPAIDRVPAALR